MTRSLVLLMLLAATPLSAQNLPVITVLGAGEIAFDVKTPTLAEAQIQLYRVRVDDRPPMQVTTTCFKEAGVPTQPPFTCTFSMSELKLTGRHTLSIEAVLLAADGELVSAPSAAPFDLRLAVPPVAPTAIRVRPR
jgi:hypothetical protein